MKVDILAFGAHPDDVELGCAGSILSSIDEGKSIGIVDLTRGELGTRGDLKTRDREAKNAAAILGVSFRKNLGFRDGFFVNDETHQLEIIKLIRTHKPNVVLCNAVDDRHIDHTKGSKLVSDACFLSGLIKIDTQQEVWRPKQVYHYIQWKDIKPDFVVDVSQFIDQKVEAIKAYKSQFFDASNKAPQTPISTQNFLNSVRYRAQNLGRLAGVDAAEGFTTERVAGIQSFDNLF
ncbi:MAG: bacillithiol biosynthesis deacetylase BshB1 [Flavobacteriaceae bacterium]|nr:bacillithiol biosynthesis deacetylase BshB1 [Flavobacteriaceae bacterium]